MILLNGDNSMTLYIIIGLVALLAIGGLIYLVIPKNKSSFGSTSTKQTLAGSEDGWSTTQPIKTTENKSGLKIEVLKAGSGGEATNGKTVSVHYTGWLTNKQKFDTSLTRGAPFDFKLGVGKVIYGWDEGVKGMKVGEKRRLTVPPKLGYGKNGNPPRIPQNATLIFEIELMGLK